MDKCARLTCNYSLHSDINNNGGTHCCMSCKNNNSHGLRCEKAIIIRKLFVIGFNKTGTCSLHNLFLKNKIISIHTTEHVLPIIDKYMAFTDGNHYNFRTYYEIYPQSLFILNTRPLKKWLVSRYKHEAIKKKKSRSWPPTIDQTCLWIEERNIHHKNILDFFKINSKKLLIINIERSGWEQKVLNFINKKILTEVKENIRDDISLDPDIINQIYTIVAASLSIKGYTGDELLYKDIDISHYKYDCHL